MFPHPLAVGIMGWFLFGPLLYLVTRIDQIKHGRMPSVQSVASNLGELALFGFVILIGVLVYQHAPRMLFLECVGALAGAFYLAVPVLQLLEFHEPHW